VDSGCGCNNCHDELEDDDDFTGPGVTQAELIEALKPLMQAHIDRIMQPNAFLTFLKKRV
jgi:hypothetical protein